MEIYGKMNPEVMSMLEILKKQRVIESIALDKITVNPFQPRRIFDEGEIEALGESIQENGLIQPVILRKTKGGFELIAGERRLRACRAIGFEKIDAVVYDIPDEVSAGWALIENLQRCDLSPFEEAEAMAKLIVLWNVGREEAARRLGLAPSSLCNKLRLLKLGDEVRKIIEENNLTERHARELLRLGTFEERVFAARHIAKNDFNVLQTERFVSSLIEKKPKKKAPRFFVKDMRIFINTFEHAVEVMNCAGLCAKSTVREEEDRLIYSVEVPKSKAFGIAAFAAESCTAPAE